MRQDRPGPSSLETALGYVFRDKRLLERALTPPSAGTSPDNQRLEFLGDAILQICVSELIYREKPDWDEGAMSKLRGLLVCTQTLWEWAKDLGLELRRSPGSVGRTPAPGGRKPRADAVEALIAAVYLDAGQAGDDPLAAAARVVSERFLQRVRPARIGVWEERDSKTTLQERAAALAQPAPAYELVERGGPDHAPVFTVRARVGPLEAVATAGTLKQAQAEAARILLGRPEFGRPQPPPVLPKGRRMG